MALFCSQCGVQNNDDALTCYNCQAQIGHLTYGAQPGHADGNTSGYTDGNASGYAGDNSAGKEPSGFQFGLGSVMIGAVCVLYLMNPTAGILEFIPDNIPLIGNLDEAAAVTGLLMALSNLGIIPYRRN